MAVLLGALVGLVILLGAAVGYFVMKPAPTVVAAAPAEAFSGDGAGGGQEVRTAPPVVDDHDLVDVGTAAPAPRASAASYGPARVQTDGVGLPLREGPGRAYGVAGKMLPGDVVTVDGCNAGTPGRRWCRWCRVVYGGLQGWALDEFLAIGAPRQDTESGLEQAFASSEGINTGAYIDGSDVSFVNLRDRPFSGGEVVVNMRPGAALRVTRCRPYGWSLGGRSTQGRWCFVTAEQDGRSASGWASDAALRW